MKRVPWLLFCALVFAVPAAARAQAVRGVVVDQASRPIGGVVVFLVDNASRTIARALSDPQGQFRIAASGSGVYRLRTLRIGFRPVLSDAFELKAGQDVERQIVVTNLPTALDTIRVVDKNACRSFSDSGAATFAVWEQVRAALTATDITTSFHNIAVTTVGYDRVLDPRAARNANRVLLQKATVSTGYVNRPWRTLPPDSLRRIGYVVTERDETVVYYAPGIDVLLSSAFAEDHCFRLTSDKQHADAIGLAFQPTPDRRRTAEIKGTLWVDRKSSELRRLEFEYVNIPAEQAEQADGNLEFVRMRDGTWAISRWFIQMPAFTSVVVPGHGAERQLAEIQATGGEIALARRGADTLWAQPVVVLSGTIRDSVSGAGIGGAKVTVSGTELTASTDDRGRFSISGMLPGVYEAEIHTPSLDSLSASHRVPFEFLNPANHVEWRVPNAQQLAALVCGADVRDPSRGMVIGRARLTGDTTAPRNLSVMVEWLTKAKATDSAAESHQARARGGADGSFRLCGVPVNASLRISATADGAETAEATTVRLQSSSRMAHADLALQPLSVLAARGSTFTGVVVSDSTHLPLGAAEVALPDLGKSVYTNASGEFRIVGIPAGEHRVMVRKIGYGAADTRLAFGGKETVERRVVLGRAVTLEPMVVTASERVRQSFDENRRLGLGHFMTREDIAKFDGMDMQSALQQIPTIGIAGHGHIWVTSRRHPFTAQVYEPSYIEKTQGMPRDCWAQVYLDGVLQNGTKEPTEPFDLKQIPVDRVEAIEFYSGGAETPLQYSRLGSQCGVLVVWTRRR